MSFWIYLGKEGGSWTNICLLILSWQGIIPRNLEWEKRQSEIEKKEGKQKPGGALPGWLQRHKRHSWLLCLMGHLRGHMLHLKTIHYRRTRVNPFSASSFQRHISHWSAPWGTITPETALGYWAALCRSWWQLHVRGFSLGGSRQHRVFVTVGDAVSHL